MKNKTGLQLIALILYLSDLKLNPEIKATKPITALALNDMILDSQDVPFFPPPHG